MLRKNVKSVSFVALSDDSAIIVSGSSYETIRRWNEDCRENEESWTWCRGTSFSRLVTLKKSPNGVWRFVAVGRWWLWICFNAIASTNRCYQRNTWNESWTLLINMPIVCWWLDTLSRYSTWVSILICTPSRLHETYIKINAPELSRITWCFVEVSGNI